MQLILAALIPVLLTPIIYWAKSKTKLGKINPIFLQVIIGVCFGLSAVFATEVGSINFMGAIINVRDAGPAVAGLIFGPVAGLTAGAIGAFDRSVIATFILGNGGYTVWACTISVFLAGLIGGLFHKWLFDERKPYLLHCSVFIMVLEVCHMWLIALFHLWDLEQAIFIMNRAFLPVLIINTLSVIFAVLIVSIQDLRYRKSDIKKILKTKKFFLTYKLYYTFQFWLIIVFISAFIISSIIVVVVFNIASFNESYAILNAHYDSFVSTAEENSKSKNVNFLTELQVYADEWSDDFSYKIAIFDEHNIPVNSNKELAADFDLIKKHPQHELIFIEGVSNSYVVYYGVEGNITVVLYAYEMYELFIAYLGQAVAIGFQILIFSIVLIVVFILIKRLVRDNLDSINKSLKEIAEGNLEETVNIDNYEEFTMLSNSINETVGTLKGYINAESERYKDDLIMAQQIQLSALPNVFPPFPNIDEIDIYAKYRSAKEVGGDFYDYYFVDDDNLCFLVADVSGKGIPAAMFMMRAKTAIKDFAVKYKDAAQTLDATNNYLCANNKTEIFVTCWLCFINIRTGHIQFASAGHNPPVLIDTKNKTAKFLKSKISLVLGGIEDVKYKNEESEMEVEQKLILYTDGITEAHNFDNKLYGNDKLLEFSRKVSKRDSQTICEELFKSTDSFIGEKEQFDDMTCICLHYRGKQAIKQGGIFKTEVSVYSVIDNVAKVFSVAEELFIKADVPLKIINQCNVATDEIFSNIVNYGYGENRNYVTVKIKIDKTKEKNLLKMLFIDSAKKFNPLDVSTPDITLKAEDRQIGGLGIFVVRNMMDEVYYEYKNSCNCLSFIKYF